MSLLPILFITECFCLVYWPEESSYSVLAESRIVNVKEYLVGETVQVKEGQRTFSGKVVAIGNRADIEKQLSDIEGSKAQGKYYDRCVCSIYMCLCMYADCMLSCRC